MSFYKKLKNELELKKEAGTFKSTMKGLRDYAAPAILSSGAMIGVYQLINQLESVNKRRAFKKLIEKEPDLLKNTDKLQVLELFSSLYDLNPEIAKNPKTAASFIRERIDMGMDIPTDLVLNLKKNQTGSKMVQDALKKGAIDTFSKGLMIGTGLADKPKAGAG